MQTGGGDDGERQPYKGVDKDKKESGGY